MKLKTYSKLSLLFLQLSFCSGTDNDVDFTSNWETLGGEEVVTVSGEFEYIVGVMVVYGPTQGITYGEKSCTGTLIRDDMVMTIASCLMYDKQFDPDPDTVRVFVRPSVHILRAIKIYINPNYYSDDQYISRMHNIGVIIIERTLQTFFPKLPDSLDSFDQIKYSCIMGGYGKKKDTEREMFTDFTAHYLNTTNAEVFKGRACFGKSVVCIHFADIMPCQADFGSPLICNGVIFALYIPGSSSSINYGVMASNCYDLYLSVFSPVYNFRDWVAQIVDAPTSKLEWLNNPWYVLLLCCVVFLVMGGIYYTLVEILQKTFDPAEGLMTMMPLDSDEDIDEDGWYESQWTR